MKRILLTIFAAMLSGCVAGSGSQLLKSPPTTVSKSPAKIEVKRVVSLEGALLDMTFTLNDEELFALGTGDSFVFYLDPGKYTFGEKLYYRGSSEGSYSYPVTIESELTYKLEICPGCENINIKGLKTKNTEKK